MSNIDLTKLITAQDKADVAHVTLLASVKARRNQAILSGITVGGVEIATDDLSQQRIMGAAVAAMLDANYTVSWKTPAGFIPLDAPTILTIASAVRSHVQACFDREADLIADIEAGDPYDIWAGWP